MTREKFEFRLSTSGSFSFEFEGKKWQFFYEKLPGREEVRIQFGELDFPSAVYSSFRELYAECWVEGCYFIDVLPVLEG